MMTKRSPGYGRPLICVVGAGIAGLTSARSILRSCPGAEVLIIGEEVHFTYLRPRLTKDFYEEPFDGAADLARSLLVRGSDHEGLSWRLGVRAVKADLANSVLSLSTAEAIEYDGLVVGLFGVQVGRWPSRPPPMRSILSR